MAQCILPQHHMQALDLGGDLVMVNMQWSSSYSLLQPLVVRGPCYELGLLPRGPLPGGPIGGWAKAGGPFLQVRDQGILRWF